MQVYLGFIGLSLVFAVLLFASYLFGIFSGPIIARFKASPFLQSKPGKDGKKKTTIPLTNEMKIGKFSKYLNEIYEDEKVVAGNDYENIGSGY